MNIPPSDFPDPLSADGNGIVCASADLNTEMLIDAYYHGIFPWPCDDSMILWAAPLMRGVLLPEEFRIPHSFRSKLKRLPYTFQVDTAFDEVIEACAAQFRPGQEGTWITPKILRAYKEFHRRGFAHSFETYDEEGVLSGGLYGISIGGIFCGESMFFRKTGASKFALVNAVPLFRECGVKLLDTQMVTPTTALFGAREIPSAQYLELLKQYAGPPVDFQEKYKEKKRLRFS